VTSEVLIKNPKANVYVIHNWMQLTTQEERQKYIDEDIFKSFDHVEKVEGKDNVWTSKSSSGDVTHVVFMDQDSIQGQQWNKDTLAWLNKVLDVIHKRKLFCFEKELLDTIYSTLHEYFKTPAEAQHQITETADLKGIFVDKSGLFRILYSTFSDTRNWMTKIISGIQETARVWYNWFLGSNEEIIDEFNVEIIEVNETVKMVKTKISRDDIHYKTITDGVLDAYLNPRFDSVSFTDFHIITVDLPGVPQAGVYVKCKDSQVDIYGMRPLPDAYFQSPLQKAITQQRRFSNFYIAISIPEGYSCPSPEQRFTLVDGVLTVMCPFVGRDDGIFKTGPIEL